MNFLYCLSFYISHLDVGGISLSNSNRPFCISKTKLSKVRVRYKSNRKKAQKFLIESISHSIFINLFIYLYSLTRIKNVSPVEYLLCCNAVFETVHEAQKFVTL